MKTQIFIFAALLSTPVAVNAQWVAIAAGGDKTATATGTTSGAVKREVLKRCPGCAWARSKTASYMAIIRCPYNKKGDYYGWGGFSKTSVNDAKEKALRKYVQAANRAGFIVRKSQCEIPIKYGDGKFDKN